MKINLSVLVILLVVSFGQLFALTIPIKIDTVITDQKVFNDDKNYNQYAPAIDVNSDGKYILTWNGSNDIFVQRYNYDGKSLGSFIKVNDTSAQSLSRVGIAEDNSFVIVWSGRQSDGFEDIYMQRYDSLGNTIGSNAIVNIHRENSNSDYPDIAMTKKGNYVIVWQQDEDICAKLFNASGVAVSEIILVNDDTEYELQRRPVVGISENGSFAVAWYDRRDKTSDIMNYDIYAQRFDSTGNMLGSNFKVNEEESSDYRQIDPSIAMDSTGNFIITWRDYRNDPSDIFAQRYNSNGNMIGTNFLVTDDDGSSGQAYPSISMTNSGTYVITWLDTRDGFVNVYAQLFENDFKLGSNFAVPNQTLVNDVSRYCRPNTQILNSNIYTVWLENRYSQWDEDAFYNILEYSKEYVDTKSISNITTDSILASGALYRLDYASQYGFCWNTTGDPSIEDENITFRNADSIGLFNSTIDGLQPNTIYNLRAFVANDLEEFKYGEVLQFRTLDFPDISDIAIVEDSVSLKLQATIMGLGYPNPSQHGFCWNTTGNPTRSDGQVRLGSVNSTGNYDWTIGGLTDNTHYYFRAYVSNSAGTIYSDNTVDLVYIKTNIEDNIGDFNLSCNFPNPFNPNTTIGYRLPEDSKVELLIYDLNGGLITTLVDEYQSTGNYKINWNASSFSSGVYVYCLKANDRVESKKMILMK
jgi:hypothetical protein